MTDGKKALFITLASLAYLIWLLWSLISKINGCINGCSSSMKKAHEESEANRKEMMREWDESVQRALEDDSESARWNRFIRGASEADSRGIKFRNSDQSR